MFPPRPGEGLGWRPPKEKRSLRIRGSPAHTCSVEGEGGSQHRHQESGAAASTHRFASQAKPSHRGSRNGWSETGGWTY